MCSREDLAAKSEPFAGRWRSASVILLLLMLVVAFFTIEDYGMGWDEPTRWRSGDAKLDYYAKLFASEQPLQFIRSMGTDDYPGLFDMTLGMIHRLTGWDRFLLGHWQSFVFGLACLFAVWRIGSVFGGVRLGFWACVLLVLTPTFYGHWFHNPKDIPFAATYTLALWGMIEWLRRFPEFKKRWFLLAALLCGLCMATRIAGMVTLAYLFAGVFILTLVWCWENRREVNPKQIFKKLVAWVIAVPVAGLLAYLTLIPWWPAGHKDVFASSGSTLQSLHTRASEIPLFFRGEIMEAADAPNYYALWMFGIKAPEIVLIGLIASVVMFWLMIRRGGPSVRCLARLPVLSILLLGAFFPLLYLTYSGPALHNGARHFLFAFPALCVVAAWGWLSFGDWIRAQHARYFILLKVVFLLLLVLPVVHLIRLHPYQYIYFNTLVGGPVGAYGSYESEYWFTSSKHAVEELAKMLKEENRMPENGQPTRIFILGPWQVAEPFLPEGYQLTSQLEEADFLILNSQMLVHQNFQGEELFRIERMGVPICVVLRSLNSAAG